MWERYTDNGWQPVGNLPHELERRRKALADAESVARDEARLLRQADKLLTWADRLAESAERVYLRDLRTGDDYELTDAELRRGMMHVLRERAAALLGVDRE